MTLKFGRLIAVILMLTSALVSNSQQTALEVNITLHGVTEKQAVVGRLRGSQIVPVDTVPVTGDSISFRINDPVRGVYRVQFNDTVSLDLVSAGETELILESDAENIIRQMKVHGSPENQLLYRYWQFSLAYDDSLKEVAYYGNLELKASNGIRTKRLDSLQNVYISIQHRKKEAITQLIDSHAGWLSAALIRAYQIPDYQAYTDTASLVLTQKDFYSIHFFDNIDFTEPGLINTEVYYIAINDYLASFAKPATTQSYMDACSAILDIANPYPLFYDYALKLLLSNFEFTIWEKVFTGLVEKYYLTYEAREPALVKSYTERISAIRSMEIGNICPPLALPDTTGHLFSLDQQPGSIKVIVFWSPGCEHCEEIMPELKRIYAMYYKRGMTILAVSIDGDKRSWLEGIKVNGTSDWYHVAEFEGLGGRVARAFNIWMTPTLYVVDADNRILLKPYSIAALERFIEENTLMNAP